MDLLCCTTLSSLQEEPGTYWELKCAETYKGCQVDRIACWMLTVCLKWLRECKRIVREGAGRHHSADFLLWGRGDRGETLRFTLPPPSTLADNWRHKLISTLLSCAPLAEGLIPLLDSPTCQYWLQWLVGLGCSEDAGFRRLSLLHFSSCWYWSRLSGKSCLSAAAAII